MKFNYIYLIALIIVLSSLVGVVGFYILFSGGSKSDSDKLFIISLLMVASAVGYLFYRMYFKKDKRE